MEGRTTAYRVLDTRLAAQEGPVCPTDLLSLFLSLLLLRAQIHLCKCLPLILMRCPCHRGHCHSRD